MKTVAEGFRLLGLADDHEILAREWIVYDALYAFCQHRAKEMQPTAKPRGA